MEATYLIVSVLLAPLLRLFNITGKYLQEETKTYYEAIKKISQALILLAIFLQTNVLLMGISLLLLIITRYYESSYIYLSILGITLANHSILAMFISSMLVAATGLRTDLHPKPLIYSSILLGISYSIGIIL